MKRTTLILRGVGTFLCLLFLGKAAAFAQVGPCSNGLVLVADGAGDSWETTDNFRRVLAQEGFGYAVQRIAWSHGRGRVLADQTDYAHLRNQGRGVAEYILTYKAQNPQAPVFLVGHSAGGMVVLAALECLPAGMVEKAFLLSPSMSCFYDVRTALRATRTGIHNFYSRCDFFVLGLTTRLVGTADNQWTACAGRVGFVLYQSGCEDDFLLYSKLYQRQWSKPDRFLGNRGFHYGNYQPDFLRIHIAPWFGHP